MATPLEMLKKHWGYDSFRPMQGEIVDSVLNGNDTLGLLPTGGGKSITFQVPALLLSGLTLVITPLISLMKDQVDNLRDRKIRATFIHSGLTSSEKNLALDRCRLGKVKLLYLSPEKLLSPSFLDELRFLNVSLIVVDEAHCISQWGYDFRPSYLQIARVRDMFPQVPVLALTASATPHVVQDIISSLRFNRHKIFALSFRRDNISYIIRYTENKPSQLLSVLRGVPGTIIVYVRSRKRAHELSDFLNGQGIASDYYHAGLLPEEKNEKQNRWKNGTTRAMVATNAFGMGIDKADVRAVVHYDLPSSLEEYYQEVGRAGRDGLHSWGVALVSQPDKGVLTRRFHEAFPEKEYIRKIYEMASVFLGVAVGDGFNRTYDFNFSLFCTRFGLTIPSARSSLDILTHAGLIEFSEDYHSSARVMMLLRKEELYSLRIDAEAERLLNAILRMYPGLFTDYVYINEQVLASSLDLTSQTVYEALLRLNRYGVLHYVPRRMTPFIHYPTSREETRHVAIPRSVYEDRRMQMEHRVKALSEFMFGTTECRSVSLLRYFGEKNPSECGHCDVCRTKKKFQNPVDRENLRRQVVELMAQGCDLNVILSRFPVSSREEVIETYRHNRS